MKYKWTSRVHIITRQVRYRSRGVSMGTELWLGESVDDLEKMKCSQYGWYGTDDFNCTTWQNKSKESIIIVGWAGFTTLLSRSNTGHSVFIQDTELWLGESADEEMRCTQHEWYEIDDFNGTERQWWVQVMLYKIYNNVLAKRRFTVAITTGSQGAYSQSVRRAHLQLLLQYSHRYSVPRFLLSLFIYNMHGELGSGLTFIFVVTNSFVLP